eukprot:Clim_evm11s128 gene=Clim_evmTU11s128
MVLVPLVLLVAVGGYAVGRSQVRKHKRRKAIRNHDQNMREQTLGELGSSLSLKELEKLDKRERQKQWKTERHFRSNKTPLGPPASVLHMMEEYSSKLDTAPPAYDELPPAYYDVIEGRFGIDAGRQSGDNLARMNSKERLVSN